MKFEDVVSNVNIYGLDESAVAERAVTTVNRQNEENAKAGGNDNYLNGIIVQFDLTLSNKAWVDAERYQFLDLVSSLSTIQRITKIDLDKVYNEYVDERIVEIMREKVAAYNELQKDIKNLRAEGKDVTTLSDVASQKYLEILYSNPAGFLMSARMTTNYRQLRKIYRQRRDHRLPEWRAFCDWIETLPFSELLTNIK